MNLQLFEIARMLVCLDHLTSLIVNANHSTDGIGCKTSNIQQRRNEKSTASDPPH